MHDVLSIAKALFLSVFIVSVYVFSAAVSQAEVSGASDDARFRVQVANPPSNSSQAREPLVALALRAKATLMSLVTPPVGHVPFLEISERDQGTPVREQLIRNLESAVDALVVLANAPETASAAERALQLLAQRGDTKDAREIFRTIIDRNSSAPGASREEEAAAARHLGAFAYFDATLTRFLGVFAYRPDMRNRVDAWNGVILTDDTNKALSAFHRAVELASEDTWSWIFIARLEGLRGKPVEAESALIKGIAGAESAGWDRGRMLALQELGRLHCGYHRFDSAIEAHQAALAIAEQLANADPGAAEARRDLAFSWNGIGDTYLAAGDRAKAMNAFGRALELRTGLATAAPDNAPWHVDLVASHLKMAAAQNNPEAATHHANKAFTIYDMLAFKDKFSPAIDPANSGVFLYYLMISGILTLLVGVLLLVLYRRSVTRYMRMASDEFATLPSSTGTPVRQSTNRNPGELALRSITDVEAITLQKIKRPGLLAEANHAFRQTVWGQAAGGMAFALTATILYFLHSNIEPVIDSSITLTWSFSWTAVITLCVVTGRNGKAILKVLLVYFGVGLLICLKLALGETEPLKINGITLPPFFHPLLPWALQAVTTLFLLLFLNRQIRAIGPLLLVFMAIVSLGAHLALVGMSTYAALKFFTSVFIAIGIDVSAGFRFIRLIGMAVCLPIAWSIITLIRRRYDTKRISDQKLTVDSIWLFSTLGLCGQLVFYAGLAGWTGLSAFVAYVLVDRAFTKPLASAASARQGARLLLLRVFGFRRRTERLFDMLGLRWRYAGPVQLIAAPDLAGRLIDPGKFLDFLSRRLRKRFIIKGGDLDRQLAQVDLRPDADGRFRVNEFFCGNDTWRQVVTRLMTGSDLVAMDLRSFSFQRKGCVFELQTLLDSVPVARIVLLVDSTTDLSFLREILAECWRGLKATSPNYMGSGTLTMLEIGRSNVVAVKALLGFAESVLYAPVPTMTPLARAEAI